MFRETSYFFLLLLVAAVAIDAVNHDGPSTSCYSKKRSTRDNIGKNNYVVLKPQSAHDALRKCVYYGDGLAIIDTEEKSQNLMEFLESVGITDGNVWVGASDIGKLPGQFYWRDGTKVDSSMWGYGDPNDYISGVDTCVNFGVTTGYLYDWKCEDSTLRPVCQLIV